MESNHTDDKLHTGREVLLYKQAGTIMMQDSQRVNTCALYILTTANAIVPPKQFLPSSATSKSKGNDCRKTERGCLDLSGDPPKFH